MCYSSTENFGIERLCGSLDRQCTELFRVQTLAAVRSRGPGSEIDGPIVKKATHYTSKSAPHDHYNREESYLAIEPSQKRLCLHPDLNPKENPNESSITDTCRYLQTTPNKMLLNSFHLNSHTLGFPLQTRKLTMSKLS